MHDLWNFLPPPVRVASHVSLATTWGRTLEAHEKIALRVRQFEQMLKFGRRFGVLSAYGPGPKHENQIRNGELFAELQRRGYRKIVPLKGSWEGVAEKSVLVPGMSFPDVVSLGRQFDQVSVIYKSLEGVIGMYYLRGGYAEAAVTPSGGMAAQIAANPELYSKARGVSFEFGFLWGKHIPWDGRTPLTREDVEAILLAEAA